jgi:hypothetical protein
MSYVSENYDKDPIAQIDKGLWIGITPKGVAYSGNDPNVDPKADEEKREHANYEYGQCVSYVKAVTPGLPQTSKWKRGAKVSPGYHQKPAHPVVVQHSQSEKAAAVHHGAAHRRAAQHGTTVHAAPPALHTAPEPSMFQQIENALDLHLNLKQYEDEALKGYEHLRTYVQDEYHSLFNRSPSALSVSAPAQRIPAGTVIATFTKEGKYHGHAAIYEKQDDTGIYVVDQYIWGHPPSPISKRRIRFKFGLGQNPTDVNDGDNFYVVE